MLISFVIPGTPVAKGRARTRVLALPGKKPFATHYTDEKTASFENRVAVFFRAKHCGPPAKGQVAVMIKAFFPIMKSWSKKVKEEIMVGDYDGKQVPSIKRPDIDNVVKTILDGLNTVAYGDDCQIYSLHCEKYYSEVPRTEVSIDADFGEYSEKELPF